MSGERYHETTRRIVEDGPRFGADRVLVYDDVWLMAHPFYQVNKWIFDHPGDRNGKRGMGWYSWKALIILETLDRCAPGDVVLYMDADSYPIADFSVIYEIAARDGAMFFKAQGHSNHRWNKVDCLIAMGQDDDATRYGPAGEARYVAIKAGDYRARQLCWEWLAYSVNRTATTFDPSRYGVEHPEFEEHRTEQSAMSNLAIKHGYKLWRECDNTGEGWNEDRDVYGQLFVQVHQGSCQNGVGSEFRNVEMP